MKALIGAGIALAIITAAIAASLLLIGPRMKEQPHLLPYQDSSCLAPEGSVPVEGAGAWPEADSPIATRSVPPTAAAGRVYYGYYCEFCHGEKGDGNGPVGRAMFRVPPTCGPKPSADFPIPRSSRLCSMAPDTRSTATGRCTRCLRESSRPRTCPRLSSMSGLLESIHPGNESGALLPLNFPHI